MSEDWNTGFLESLAAYFDYFLASFEKWGIDFVGPINPVSRDQKSYIILAIDYPTKKVEAQDCSDISLRKHNDAVWQQI